MDGVTDAGEAVVGVVAVLPTPRTVTRVPDLGVGSTAVVLRVGSTTPEQLCEAADDYSGWGVVCPGLLRERDCCRQYIVLMEMDGRVGTLKKLVTGMK